MKIKYNGHASFTLYGTERSIIIDPFGDIGYEQERDSVDYCLCTHTHYDHYAVGAADEKFVIDFNNYSSFDWLKGIESFHDEVKGAKRGRNLIFVFECDGIKFCHMGDIGQPLDLSLTEKIGKVDVLMIPVGGNYTIDCAAAYDYVTAINPALAIPMHYKTKRSNIDIDGKKDFLSCFDKVIKSGRIFTLDKNSLPETLTALDIDDSEF